MRPCLAQRVVCREIRDVIRLNERIFVGHGSLDIDDAAKPETGGLILVILEHVRLVENRIAGDPRNRELEELVALGVKRFFSFGLAGGSQASMRSPR